LTVVRNRTSSL